MPVIVKSSKEQRRSEERSRQEAGKQRPQEATETHESAAELPKDSRTDGNINFRNQSDHQNWRYGPKDN